nr:unnamed protein product [Digitaria exilis]
MPPNQARKKRRRRRMPNGQDSQALLFLRQKPDVLAVPVRHSIEQLPGIHPAIRVTNSPGPERKFRGLRGQRTGVRGRLQFSLLEGPSAYAPCLVAGVHVSRDP